MTSADQQDHVARRQIAARDERMRAIVEAYADPTPLDGERFLRGLALTDGSKLPRTSTGQEAYVGREQKMEA